MGRHFRELPEVPALAAQGLCCSQIAKRLGAYPATVYCWAVRNGVEIPKAGKSTDKAQRALQLAAEGLYIAEIAREIGYTAGGVFQLLRRNGVKAGSCKDRKAKTPKNVARAEKMSSMYRQGLTLEKIGQHFGITRERVRQIIARVGVTRDDRLKKPITTEADRKARLDANSMARWGIPYDEKKRRRADGTILAFTNQRNAAKGRRIFWSLKFVDWLAVWEASGKMHLRGRGVGRYVMSRVKDEGGYVLGNVHIQLSTENNSQGLAKCRANRAKNTGVWMLYPGLSQPWIAKYGKTLIGRYATEQEATDARKAYMDAHPDVIHFGRGYYVDNSGKTPRYQVMLGKRYVGTFKTPEEALAARAAAEARAA